jgi:mRNA-degrading endonuclease toxin of MazEF toxin-antitoxin module
MPSKLRSVMIQLRDDQISRLDQWSASSRTSRSQLIRDAVDAALAPAANTDLAGRYAAAYSTTPGHAPVEDAADGPGWAELWWCVADGAPAGPALVLSRPEAARTLPQLLVVRPTAVAHGLPSEVILGEPDGVPPCVLDLHAAERVARESLMWRLGVLSAPRWHDVATALRHAVNG